MQRIVPIFYTMYGRYISRFRAIPYEIDCLIPVYRRVLLSLHEVASKKLVKCGKIVGHCLGTYHPHGDQSIYGSLIELYNQGLIKKQGNFGNVGFFDDDPPAAYRYTEAQIEKWVDDFAFKYIDSTHWENIEHEEEPIFLPSPLPLGLIGNEIYMGIAYHKTVVPRFELKDLAKRLKSLLLKEKPFLIYPSTKWCNSYIDDDKVEMNNILKTGQGKLKYCPDAEIKNKTFFVYGKAPNNKTRLGILRQKEDVSVRDISPKNKIVGEIKPKKRMSEEETDQFYAELYDKYICNTIHFSIYVCDHEGKVKLKGVDDILLLNYEYYKQVVKFDKVKKCINKIEKKFDEEVIMLIRKVLEKNPTVKVINDIINIINTNTYNKNIQTEEYDEKLDNFININKIITDDDIKRICSNRNIKSLIEYKINTSNTNQEIQEIKQSIIDNDKECLNVITELAK